MLHRLKVSRLFHYHSSRAYLSYLLESKPGSAKVNRIVLLPLSEEEVTQYVASTLCRPPEDVAPLGLVIQSKTGGNPFYMREMISACHRIRCIWYDYRESRWNYNLNKLLDHFQGERDFEFLNNEFVTRRLNELPPASRAILAWAAILGNSFSFALICQLLSSEFSYKDAGLDEPSAEYLQKPYSKEEAVAGLQAAVNACIIIQGETDERFRFAHDRYIQAASTLKIDDTRKMHFIVAQTLLKYQGTFSPSKDNIASHICEATDIIRAEIPTRRLFRKHLVECAASSAENGARSTAAKYYCQALKLLQPDPWVDGEDDTCYDETLKLHIRAAECYVYMGHHSAAHTLLGTIFSSAKTAEDKAPAWLLQSRVLAQNGDAEAALTTLKQSLVQLNVKYDPNPTFEKCDERFMGLAPKIQSVARHQLLNPLDDTEPHRVVIGAILAEAISAAWWSDCLDFYNLALTLVDLHLEEGAFPQSGIGFLHLAMVALSRFNMVEFAAELGSQCVEYLDRSRDAFSLARGYMLFANFLSHIYVPIRMALNHSEQSVENAASAGDRQSAILSFGLSAQMRFFASENLADLESICQYSCEEIPGWHQDTRGGTFLISVRQVCRALQGKTNTAVADEVMSDEQHHTASYKQFLNTKTRNGGRSILIYETMEIVPLYIYGHYEQACEVGRRCLDNLGLIWSSRNTRLALLFHGLALAGLMVRKLNDPRHNPNDLKDEVQETIEQLEDFSNKMKVWQVVSDVNYLAWSKFLDAQLAELRGEHGFAIQEYETALDHAAEHSFLFEEALGNFLMAGFFIRQSARRSATAVLKESVALWRQLGASGLAQRIEEEHALLLHGPIRNPRSVEVGVQTDFAGDATSVTYAPAEGDEIPHSVHQFTAESRASRTAAWRGSMQPEAGAGLPALDMIDLHAILVSSQVISSVLQVDVLLKTMCDVILQTCGASVTQAAIIVQDEDARNDDEWCIAASGDAERGATAHIPGRPLAGSSQVAENVILYCARFRDSVFLPDLLNDERFGNVSESWLQRNPLSKAVIAIPICHGSKPLLGVLYLEGEPGSFTDRNLTVLQLLVNQIGISYSNALSMKSIEKVSEQNNAMVEVQKRALAQAIEAQEKAKHAEAEANRNVKIAEEAAKAKSIFLANVSHELRTPLNGVIGNSELLRDSIMNKEQLEMAESIRVSADLLLTVINDILDFSKMEADKMKLYVIAFNPEEMVREVIRAVSYSNREKASKKNVKIIQDINLPPMLIYGDPIRLHQVLGNLIGNSLKFTEDGSITIGARIDADTPKKATLTFWVKDTGIGIPPKQLAKLFRPFSQADASTARKYGGSGLGLSICKSLIETMMKGRIELESEENVGTTAWFTVSFDKAKPEVSAGDAQASTLPQVPDRTREALREVAQNPYLDLAGIPKDQVRICIAEDNLINQKIAINYVRRLGYTNVDAYENGLKAVEGLRQQAKEGKPYHVVLMDVQMPVLDGYEATKLLRKDEIEAVRKVLVIAMTASAIQGDREKCLAAGMNDYLAKPVKADLLKRKLDTYTTGQVQGQHPLWKDGHGHEHSDQTPAPTSPVMSEATNDPPPVVAVRKDNPALQSREFRTSENPSIAEVIHSKSNTQQQPFANGDDNDDGLETPTSENGPKGSSTSTSG